MKYPVDNIDNAYNACNPEKPLPVDDERYVELDEARGNKAGFVKKIALNIKRTHEDEGKYYRTDLKSKKYVKL